MSRDEIDRLRLEADTIMTRYREIESELERARETEGEHWESGELEIEVDSPGGETLELSLDLDLDPGEHAECRYSHANQLERELERRREVVDELDPVPADPLAYLILYHLDRVEGNYPKSMAGYLDGGRKHVEELCKKMVESGILERVESGTVKQRRVKAKKAKEVRQHHTYYRLSREGDHLLRFLDSKEAKLNVLKHLPDSAVIMGSVVETGSDSPKSSEIEFEKARHIYRVLDRLSFVGKDGEDSSSGSTVYTPTDLGSSLTEKLDVDENI